MHPAAPMGVIRPFTVRLSSALLFAVAGLALLEAVAELVFVNTDLSMYRDAYTGDSSSGFASLTSATVDIFFAAGASILAILNNHGRNNARVVTLVLGGIFLFCGGFGNLSDGLHRPISSAGPGRLGEVLPAAYGIFIGILDILTVLTILGALVLLALPPSNRFFHTRPQPLTGYAPPGPPSGPTPPHGLTPYPTPPHGLAPYPPPPALPPHTGSMPAIDPWADHP